MMSILQFLRAELAPTPGRLHDVLRITLFTVLVVILTETFQMPFPAYSAYIVFFISKEENASTLLIGIGVTLAVTLSVILALGIYTISAGEPGLRLPLMALVIFLGMFFSRASPLGPAAFVTGFLATMALTLIDFVPTDGPTPIAQRLTKAVLWLWPVVMLPVGIVIVGNIIAGRKPLELFREGLKQRLELVGRLLQEPHDSMNDRKKLIAYAHEGVANLRRYLKLDGMFRKSVSQEKLAYERYLTNTEKLITLIVEWLELNVSNPQLKATASECGTRLLLLGQHIETKQSKEFLFPKLNPPLYAGNLVSERKAFLLLATIIELLELMAPSQTASIAADSSKAASKKLRDQLLVQDAFSNPDYLQYALKTTLAIFIAYIMYNLLNWPGIRTCMITCFFVSLGTFGETAQKMTLRLSGAIIGGGLGLASVIFLMPHLTTITGLCLLIAVFTFFSAWVSTSSERLSYAGYQIALAFFLCNLVGYAPTVDITEGRDRVVGILLGNLIIALIFALVWPTSAIARARNALTAALDKLSNLFSKGPLAWRENQAQCDALTSSYSDAIFKARRFVSLHMFEPKHIQPGAINVDIRLIERIEALRGPMILLAEGPLVLPMSVFSNKELEIYYQLVSEWLSKLSEQIKGLGFVILPLPNINPLVKSLENSDIDAFTYQWLLAYIDWHYTLEERLHALEIMIRKSIVSDTKTLKQAMREST